MKKPKHAKMQVKTYMANSYSVTCPHCHTILEGGFGPDVLMLKCYHCGGAIDFRSLQARAL